MPRFGEILNGQATEAEMHAQALVAPIAYVVRSTMALRLGHGAYHPVGGNGPVVRADEPGNAAHLISVKEGAMEHGGA